MGPKQNIPVSGITRLLLRRPPGREAFPGEIKYVFYTFWL